MKNIFVLSNSLQSGGAEKQAIILTSILKSNYNAFLIVFNKQDVDPKLKAIIQSFKVEVLFIDENILIGAIKLFFLIKKKKPEVIFSYLAKTNFMNATIGKLAGVVYRIGGIRNAYIPYKKNDFPKVFTQQIVKLFNIKFVSR